jgi:hypothetical protein
MLGKLNNDQTSRDFGHQSRTVRVFCTWVQGSPLLTSLSCPFFPLASQLTAHPRFSCRAVVAVAVPAHIITKTAGSSEGPISQIALLNSLCHSTCVPTRTCTISRHQVDHKNGVDPFCSLSHDAFSPNHSRCHHSIS